MVVGLVLMVAHQAVRRRLHGTLGGAAGLHPLARLEMARGNTREALASLDALDRLVQQRHFAPHWLNRGAAVRAQYEVWRDHFIQDASQEVARVLWEQLAPSPNQPNVEKLDLKAFYSLDIPKSYGRLIYIASVRARLPFPRGIALGTAKAGLVVQATK